MIDIRRKKTTTIIKVFIYPPFILFNLIKPII